MGIAKPCTNLAKSTNFSILLFKYFIFSQCHVLNHNIDLMVYMDCKGGQKSAQPDPSLPKLPVWVGLLVQFFGRDGYLPRSTHNLKGKKKTLDFYPI